MKPWLTILSILILNLNFVLGQSNLKELIAENEKAIFSIFTYDAFGVPNGSGTGFFISSEGVGISNYHVLEGASNAIIKMNNEKTYRITDLLEENENADLIKFKIENKENVSFPFLTTKTTSLQKGEEIFVIGNPHGLENTVSEGIVSSIRETEGYEEVIQITAPISPGSSGSPVMTLDGKVVAVATFQYKEGQNLNFAVTARMIDRLVPINQSLAKPENTNFIVINERCQHHSELVLNSIEFNEYETILNFSFTNVTMGFGPDMLIWSEMNNKDKKFFIQDLETMDKYYATSSTIGASRDKGTKIALGETKRFKVFFPFIPRTVRRINIMEGPASSWKFMNLNLVNYLNIENQQTDDYGMQYALTKLETQDYQNAKLLLSDRVEANKGDHDAYNMIGIISYILDNNYDALKYFSLAIEVDPTNDIYYVNRFRVYYEKKQDLENALQDISMAISIKPSQGDYYQFRALVYMAQQDWKKATADFDLAINLMGEIWYLLKQRGICKTWLQDYSGACRDWNDAYRLCNYLDTELKDWIKEVCN